MALPSGGRRPISEDTVNLALILAAVLLTIFFLLALRVYFDKKSGAPIAPLKPTRSPYARTR